MPQRAMGLQRFNLGKVFCVFTGCSYNCFGFVAGLRAWSCDEIIFTMKYLKDTKVLNIESVFAFGYAVTGIELFYIE